MKQFYDLIINGMTNNKIEKEMAIQLVTMFKRDIAASLEDIAIIGMSAKFPGSSDVEEFWANVLNEIDSVGNFPESRQKTLSEYFTYHAGDYAKHIQFLQGAYLEDIDKFDYKLFRISPKESRLIDPAHRLFLETVWETIEDAGYGGKRIQGSNTGIYVGYNFNTVYKNMISEVDPYSVPFSIIGNKAPMMSSRLSQMLDLKGPTIILDTTCSSSNVSLHLACQGIKKGDCDMAIAAGIRLNLLPLYDDNSELGVVASEGRTRAFDDNASGMVGGEGLVSILLKPLSKAKKDKDNIYAVIKGSAINQDGTSVSITAPNRASQTSVILKAWQDCGISPETISYIEAFGSGTKIGDAIELEGLSDAFKKYTDKKQFCAISTVKTNIGHLNECSGLAGLVKAVMSLKDKKIPPTNNFIRPNRDIDFNNSALYINTKARDWVSNEYPRRCGVSTFGLSGTNSHTVLEEYIDSSVNNLMAAKLRTGAVRENGSWHLLAMSAKSLTSLKALLSKYSSFIDSTKDHKLGDICYTANTGRGHYEFRIVITINSIDDLRQKLFTLRDMDFTQTVEPWFSFGEHRIARENREIEKVVEITEGRCFELSKRVKAKIEEYISAGKTDEKALYEIGYLYVRGADVVWDLLYEGEMYRKISLPVYQFDRHECWFEVTAEAKELNHSDVFNRFVMMYSGSGKRGSNYEVVLMGRDNNDYTPNEKVTAQVWGEALGLKEIGIQDNFIAMGGDSLLGISIANKIREKTGKYVNPVALLKYQTVSEFSEYLDEIFANGNSEYVNKYPDIEPVEEREYYPVSYAQKRMFIMNKLDKSGIGYNMFRVVKIDHKIDPQRFEAAIKELINRHEAFRTSVEFFNGEVVQRIRKNCDFKVDYMEADETSLNNIIDNFKQPFDLSNPPLLRVTLVKLSDMNYVLLMDMHHVITDAVSTEIFWREFSLLYQGIKLPEISLQYKDFAVWQNKVMQSEIAKEQEKYWLDKFSGKLPTLNIPPDYPRPDVLKYEGETVTFYSSDEFSEKIKSIMFETKTSHYMVLLAVYNILLSKYTLQEDIIVGTPVIGRLSPEWNNIIGMFINTLPIRNYPVGGKTFRQFLMEVKENVLNAFENQDYQMDELVDKLNYPKYLNRHFLFDTIFSVRSIGENKEVISSSNSDLCEEVYNISDYDLTLEAVINEKNIKFHFEYCKALFKRETIERIMQDYLSILEAVAMNLEIEIENIEFKSSKLINPVYKECEDVIFNL